MKKKPRRRRKTGVSDELRAIYAAAEKDGIWILEFAVPVGFMAAARPISKIERFEKRVGREIDIAKKISRLASPGTGESREKACRMAVAACKKSFKMP